MQYDENKQFLSDFVSCPVRPIELFWEQADENGAGCEIRTGVCDSPYGIQKPGLTPSGWYCTTLPYQPLLDKYGANAHAKEHHPINELQNSCWAPYNWDEISWFAMQNKSYRDLFCRYAYFKSKCLDKEVNFSFVIMQDIHVNGEPGNKYNAIDPVPGLFPAVPTITGTTYPNKKAIPAYSFFSWGQQRIIKEILTGLWNSPFRWVMHSFTKEDVLDPAAIPDVKSDLIFVGNDRMYYISTDGKIHGYIKDNGFDGTWVGVSPTYAAAIDYQQYNQVQAMGSLVASPDGKRLLYIGVDGFIYGFDVQNVWNYKYIEGFMRSEMINEEIRAKGDLIYPTNDRIYYIGGRLGNADKFVRGFIRGNSVLDLWYKVWPAYSSQYYYGQSMNWPAQKAASGLVYSGVRLYYTDAFGYLRFYNIVDDDHYWFNSVVEASFVLAQSGIRMTGRIAINGNKFFFIGVQQGSNLVRIYCLKETGFAQWQLISVSQSASQPNYNNNNAPTGLYAQMQPAWELTASPDGKMVTYVGQNGRVYYYLSPDNSDNYAYGAMPNHISAEAAPAIGGRLQFRDNETLFCVAPPVYGGAIEKMARVCYFKFERAHCANSAIGQIE